MSQYIGVQVYSMPSANATRATTTAFTGHFIAVQCLGTMAARFAMSSFVSCLLVLWLIAPICAGRWGAAPVDKQSHNMAMGVQQRALGSNLRLLRVLAGHGGNMTADDSCSCNGQNNALSKRTMQSTTDHTITYIRIHLHTHRYT